jgi:hypothetical protein
MMHDSEKLLSLDPSSDSSSQAWKRELLALRKKIEKITGRKRGRGRRLKVVTLFHDERLTDAILEFLAETEIGRRYE